MKNKLFLLIVIFCLVSCATISNGSSSRPAQEYKATLLLGGIVTKGVDAVVKSIVIRRENYKVEELVPDYFANGIYAFLTIPNGQYRYIYIVVVHNNETYYLDLTTSDLHKDGIGIEDKYFGKDVPPNGRRNIFPASIIVSDVVFDKKYITNFKTDFNFSFPKKSDYFVFLKSIKSERLRSDLALLSDTIDNIYQGDN